MNIGKKYGRLTIIGEIPKRPYWPRKVLCRCDCGVEKAVDLSCLKTGNTSSCGCYRREATSLRWKTIRDEDRIEHRVWGHMNNRCRNPNNKDYKYYGGRGIKICKRWNKFENFIKDMGHRPSSKDTLERVNNEKGYSPSNCVWADQKTQCNNTRKVAYIFFKGKKQRTRDLIREYKILPSTYYRRLKNNGMSPEQALLTPVYPNGKGLK